MQILGGRFISLFCSILFLRIANEFIAALHKQLANDFISCTDEFISRLIDSQDQSQQIPVFDNSTSITITIRWVAVNEEHNDTRSVFLQWI